jgi:hypothetical protein
MVAKTGIAAADIQCIPTTFKDLKFVVIATISPEDEATTTPIGGSFNELHGNLVGKTAKVCATGKAWSPIVGGNSIIIHAIDELTGLLLTARSIARADGFAGFLPAIA